MPIGDSKGAFYEDEFRQASAPWFIDPKMEISPNKAETDKQLDKQELNPSTGLGIEVNSDEVDWSKLNQPTGSVGMIDMGDSPLSREIADFKKRASEPIKDIRDPEGIQEAINVALGAGPGTMVGISSKVPITVNNYRQWTKGSDGKLRYEISDQGMKLADRDWTFGESGKLSDFVEHPELFKAYPELKDINFKVADKDYKYIGGSNKETNTLTINPSQVKAGDEGLLDVITHELQHAVQNKEGFSPGSNPEAALKTALDSLAEKIYATKGAAKSEMIDLYFTIRDNAKKFGEYMYTRVPGEVEANSAAARRKLSDETRQNIPVKDMEKLFEGTDNSLHGGKYVPEFNYP